MGVCSAAPGNLFIGFWRAIVDVSSFYVETLITFRTHATPTFGEGNHAAACKTGFAGSTEH